jgi:TolB-like protein
MALIVLATLTAGAFAQTSPAGVTTRPAGGSDVSVYVAPLTESGSVLRPGWLGGRLAKAIRGDLEQIQNISVVTSDETQVKALASDQTGPTPNDYHLEKARKANAEVAVIGKATVSGDKVNVNGDVLDVSNGNSFGKFKASGSTRELFSVEDAVVRQVHEVVSRIAGPSQRTSVNMVSAGAESKAPGGRYEGSSLQASLSGNTRARPAGPDSYNQQPYHVVEGPDLQFLLPYAYGGYGYGGYYGWPSYSYINPYYYGYWWPYGYRRNVIIINNNGGGGGNGGTGSNPTPGRPNTVQPTVPVEVRTRHLPGSTVATPPPNTVQRTPSYEIRPVKR